MSYHAAQDPKSSEHDERRRFARCKHRVPCILHAGGESHRGFVIDLSARGMFLQTNASVPEGSSLRLELQPRDEKIEVLATVARRRKPHRSAFPVMVAGIGLEIGSAPESYYQLVAELGTPSN
ncbi:MAG: PilZ domain-containing protein [Proteobacteria bacterium]|nr:PilZ domain-containing protein [Pseudomonadota bacterium]